MARRILLLNERDPEHPLAGGAEIHLFEIFSRLAMRGYEITHLAASFRDGKREDEVMGVRVRRLANRYAYYGLVPFFARSEAATGRYDVVVDALNKLPFFSPWTTGLPCFTIVHHLFGTTAFRQVSFPVALVTWASEKLIPMAYRRVPILAISPSTKMDLTARGIAAENIWVVPPGLDPEIYRLEGELGGRESLVVWVGRLEPYKRVDVMIEAMARVVAERPQARLVIVGAGSARASLEATAKGAGIEGSVAFTGFVSEREKVDWYRRAAAVVNTSEKEGWGMTMIEGNACGAPSVASDVPGLRDAVRDGKTGLVVPYGDSGALAAALLRVLGDETFSRALAQEGLGWAGRFSWDAVAEDAARLIEEAIHPGAEPVRLTASPFEG